MTKEEAIKWLREMSDKYVYSDPYYIAIDTAIKSLSADVRENVRGKWIEPTNEGIIRFDSNAYAECFVCGKKEFLGWRKNYCPNCGADMRERRTDAEIH